MNLQRPLYTIRRSSVKGNTVKSVLETTCINPLADDKILCLPKLKAFVDDNSNVTQNVKAVFHRIKNIVEREENAGYQHFLLFPQCFQKAFSYSASKVVIVW